VSEVTPHPALSPYLVAPPSVLFPLFSPAVQAIVYRTLEALALPPNSNKAPQWVFGWPTILALPAALRDWNPSC
jgi:hypothetical protein